MKKPEDGLYVLEEIDIESHKIREVYALYGLCMFISQGLERILGILLAGCYFTRPTNMTAQKYDERLEETFRQTFGITVKEWCKFETDSALSDRIKKAVATRNWLAHRYFWERSGHFVSAVGVDFMLTELTKIRDEFDYLDELFREKALEYNAKIGVPPEFLEEASRLIEKQALDHINERRSQV